MQLLHYVQISTNIGENVLAHAFILIFTVSDSTTESVSCTSVHTCWTFAYFVRLYMYFVWWECIMLKWKGGTHVLNLLFFLIVSWTFIIERDMYRLFLGATKQWLPVKKIYLFNTGTSVKAWDNVASFWFSFTISLCPIWTDTNKQEAGERTAAI